MHTNQRVPNLCYQHLHHGTGHQLLFLHFIFCRLCLLLQVRFACHCTHTSIYGLLKLGKSRYSLTIHFGDPECFVHESPTLFLFTNVLFILVSKLRHSDAVSVTGGHPSLSSMPIDSSQKVSPCTFVVGFVAQSFAKSFCFKGRVPHLRLAHAVYDIRGPPYKFMPRGGCGGEAPRFPFYYLCRNARFGPLDRGKNHIYAHFCIKCEVMHGIIVYKG